MSKASSRSFSREKFLQLCTRICLGLAGILGLGGLVRYFSHQPEPDHPSTFDLGPAADFPSSGSLVRSDIPAIIYQTDQGFQAYTLICTHLGCTVEESEGGFSCPCHGSTFSADGRVLTGPAVDDLEALEVELTETGNLLVHISRGDL